MSKKVRVISSVNALISVLALMTLWACTVFSLTLGSIQIQNGNSYSQSTDNDPFPASISTSAEIDTTWRHTKHGWQDSARWPVETPIPHKTIEFLHPFVWAGIVLISVIATTIWASNEWEIARLFEDEVESETER